MGSASNTVVRARILGSQSCNLMTFQVECEEAYQRSINIVRLSGNERISRRIDGLNGEAKVLDGILEPIGHDFSNFQRNPTSFFFQSDAGGTDLIQHWRLEDGDSIHLDGSSDCSIIEVDGRTKQMATDEATDLVHVNPNGGVFGQLSGWNWVEMDPQMGLVDFAPHDFLGEFEIHRLHLSGGSLLQGVPYPGH